jgi:hypothetical protein
MLQLIRLVVTVSSVAQVPERLKKYSETLDRTDPLQPPRAGGEPGRKVKENRRGVSVKDFIAEIRGWGKFVSAWYEKKEVGDQVYHNCVYIWAEASENAAVDPHFRPVRRAIEEEFDLQFENALFDLRVWWDNQYCDKQTGEPIEGARRWEVLLRSPRPANGKQPEELHFV